MARWRMAAVRVAEGDLTATATRPQFVGPLYADCAAAEHESAAAEEERQWGEAAPFREAQEPCRLDGQLRSRLCALLPAQLAAQCAPSGPGSPPAPAGALERAAAVLLWLGCPRCGDEEVAGLCLRLAISAARTRMSAAASNEYQTELTLSGIRKDNSRESGKRKKRARDSALKWDDAEAQKALAAAAAPRSAEGSGAAEAEGAPEVVAGRKATAPSARKWRNGLAEGGLNANRRSIVVKVADRVLAREIAATGAATACRHAADTDDFNFAEHSVKLDSCSYGAERHGLPQPVVSTGMAPAELAARRGAADRTDPDFDCSAAGQFGSVATRRRAARRRQQRTIQQYLMQHVVVHALEQRNLNSDPDLLQQLIRL
ncbi:unnamed protein product [Prorocentrum cordatum]|uniref:Uncharacterized protein n=1 Tax=Prorocentrum cordatum TaxID=2364126 RepID=A0ABN9R3M8_9DINO|nr:unnamed protein product [Polarella glacialis]